MTDQIVDLGLVRQGGPLDDTPLDLVDIADGEGGEKYVGQRGCGVTDGGQRSLLKILTS